MRKTRIVVTAQASLALVLAPLMFYFTFISFPALPHRLLFACLGTIAYLMISGVVSWLLYRAGKMGASDRWLGS